MYLYFMNNLFRNKYKECYTDYKKKLLKTLLIHAKSFKQLIRILFSVQSGVRLILYVSRSLRTPTLRMPRLRMLPSGSSTYLFPAVNISILKSSNYPTHHRNVTLLETYITSIFL